MYIVSFQLVFIVSFSKRLKTDTYYKTYINQVTETPLDFDKYNYLLPYSRRQKAKSTKALGKQAADRLVTLLLPRHILVMLPLPRHRLVTLLLLTIYQTRQQERQFSLDQTVLLVVLPSLVISLITLNQEKVYKDKTLPS